MTEQNEPSTPPNSHRTPEQYDIADGETATELCEAVKSYMDNGWRPLGGVSVAASNFEDRNGYSCTSYIFVQAMVKP